MSDPQSFIVSVVYKGSTKPLSLPPIREGIGHHSMQDLAEGIAGVFEIAPEQQRVIYKGKKIDIAEHDNDDAIPFPSGSKVCRKLQFLAAERNQHRDPIYETPPVQSLTPRYPPLSHTRPLSCLPPHR